MCQNQRLPILGILIVGLSVTSWNICGRSQNITATLSIIGGVDTDQLEIDVINSMTAYVNALGVGSDIIFNELIYSIMDVFGITDVDLTVPTENVTIAATQVGRIGTVTLLGV